MSALQFKSFDVQEAQEYFSQINPIAQRIASDINTAKSTYVQFWHTLKPNEQNDVINETLIKQDISIKYLHISSSSSFILPLPGVKPTSAEQIFNWSIRNRVKKYLENIYDSPAEKSLTGVKFEQNKSLLSSPLALRNQLALPSQVNGKIKPPSSPPPPPPVVNKPYTANSGTNLILERSNVLCTKNVNTETEVKTYYAYDGKNLYSYAAQEIALKIVSDDVLGSYRDEHSKPFSYCTISEFDMQKPYCNNEMSSNAPLVLSNEPNNENLSKYLYLNRSFEQFQQELKEILKIQHGKARNKALSNIAILTGFNNMLFYGKNGSSQNIKLDIKKQSKFALQKVIESYPDKALQKLTSGNINTSENEQNNLFHKKNEKNNTKSEILIDLLSSNSVYTDAFFEQGESATLMQNYSNRGISASSSNMSDDEHRNYEYDDEDVEKTLCKDIRLLDNDLNLRRELDFLNNW